MDSCQRIINSAAPMRICDLGGWTDTWFAQHGAIVNIGVYPFVQAQMFVRSRDDQESRINIFAENYGERFSVDDGRLPEGKHALIEAAFSLMRVPDDVAIEVHLYSDAPAGASTGTSAALSVALIGALDMLTPGRLSPYEAARVAQRIETEVLGLQCGVQDQICSAYGGINYIQMSNYPEASVSPIHIPNSLWWELESRLMLVYLGSAHVSSDVHKRVIKNLEASGAEDRRLAGLRQEAERAKNALLCGDFAKLALAMNANTEWQRQMHEGLVGKAAETVIALARRHGAMGWKVNGAGGEGGSLTLLFGPVGTAKRRFARDLAEAVPQARIIPIYLSRFGLRVWESPAE
ncbi:MAG TPA: GHMP kinase [Candidatus Brocadiia bacterium]|nr:GHMP kinase [Candidatus Brocadiia bacterium]